MKNPTTAPSNDKIKLTSMAKTPTSVAASKNKIVKEMNSLLLIWGLLTSDRNYLRVRKNRMGRTEKFWKRIPVWTSLPKIKNMIS